GGGSAGDGDTGPAFSPEGAAVASVAPSGAGLWRSAVSAPGLTPRAIDGRPFGAEPRVMDGGPLAARDRSAASEQENRLDERGEQRIDGIVLVVEQRLEAAGGDQHRQAERELDVVAGQRPEVQAQA